MKEKMGTIGREEMAYSKRRGYGSGICDISRGMCIGYIVIGNI